MNYDYLLIQLNQQWMQNAKNKDLFEFQGLHDVEFLAFIVSEKGVNALYTVLYMLT